ECSNLGVLRHGKVEVNTRGVAARIEVEVRIFQRRSVEYECVNCPRGLRRGQRKSHVSGLLNFKLTEVERHGFSGASCGCLLRLVSNAELEAGLLVLRQRQRDGRRQLSRL